MAMASSSSLSTTLPLHHLLRPPPRRPLLCVFFRPLCTTTSTTVICSKYQKAQLQKTSTILFSSLYSLPTPPLLFSSSLSASSLCLPSEALNRSLSLAAEEEEIEEGGDIDDEIENDFDDDDDEEEEEEEEVGIESGNEMLELKDGLVVDDNGSSRVYLKVSGVKEKVPNLTVKEKKELASYAHGLGKKLKCQLVGKSGVTDNVVSSFIETLEANELLKIKIHRTCPGELEDVVQQLEEATGSVVVGQIGRTIIIYRPSLTKLKAEEKKKQACRVFVRKEAKLNPAPMPGRQVPRLSGCGRRGSSRVCATSFSDTLLPGML